MAMSIENLSSSWMRPGTWRTREIVSDPVPALSMHLQMIPELDQNHWCWRFKSRALSGNLPAVGDLMTAANGDGFRALVVDGKRKIVGHGLLNKPEMFPSGVIIWQIAAAVTTQHYLAEMSRDLKKIKGGIEQTQRWLSNERIASLQANAKMLAEIEIGLASDKSFLAKNVYYQNALGEIDRDCSKIARACALDLQGYIEEVQRADLTALWSSDGRALLDLLPKVSAAADAAGFALTMRTFNTGLLSLLLGDLNIVKFRADDTKTIYADIVRNLESFELEANRRIDALKEWTSFPEMIAAKKAQFRSRKDEGLSHAKRRLKAVPRAMESCDHSFDSITGMRNRPLTVDVELIRGQAIYRL